MDKQMIEEIQKILEYCCNEYDEKGRHIRNKCNSFDCEYYDETNGVCASYSLKEARALYNAGYRKIPDRAVVLTREEEQKYLAYKIIEPQIRGCLDRERELEKRLETVRKVTAEKFAERLKEKLEENSPIAGYDLEDLDFDGETIQECIDEIVKELTGEGQ